MEANMNDLTIHTYSAAEPGLFVNSYLLETTAGVVLIDASLLVSDAQALAARLTALHKPLLAAFVTHAHPDHFNGLPYVVGADVPVYATAAVAATMELDDDARTKLTDLLGRYLPQAPLPWMVGLGADAVAAELAADLVKPGEAA
jgi:glyoxylase-like metal-dependent hydrolase (beta-lactamase superfamily II)